MKIRINDLLIISFFILISFVIKKIQFVPIAIAVILIFFDSKIDTKIKNLIYLALATTVFVPFFVFFVFYLPFVVFGSILENSSFIKKYVFGISVTLVLRLIVYHSSTLHIPISEYFILFLLLVFLSLAYFVYIKKNGVSSLKNLFSVNSEDYKILIITLFFLFFVAYVMYNGTSLYQSNGTQIYTKQLFVIDSIEKYQFFPLYDPSIGMGEQLFLTDSPTHFTKDILILATIFLKDWFNAVLIYNTYSMFILWIVILAASLLLKEVLSKNHENNSEYVTYFVILGSLSIGLSFQYIRILESFKSFSAHTINLLLFSMILSKPKKPVEWFVIAYLMLFSYMVHVLQSIGVFIFATSLLIVIYVKDLENILLTYKYITRNKLKVFFVIVLFIGVLLNYTATGYLYREYLREHPKGIFSSEPIINIIGYIKNFFIDENTTPFSIRYPDLQRLDTKQSGFFISVIGGLSFFYIIFNFKNEKSKKARVLNFSYLLQFLFYAIIINVFNLGNLEPGYRIILPYTVVVLATSICVFFYSFNSKQIKIILGIIFFAFLLHSFFYVRINLENIHSESIISGSVLKSEVEFVKSLPIDGRIITYGLFANAVDAGMASVTEKYFTRYQYNLWSELNNIYEKVHTQHSFGLFPSLDNITGLELKNYYIMGGYKYLFLNICHPAGNLVAVKMYPNYSSPLYQNQCLVFLKVNNATYVDKVSVIKNVDEEMYKRDDGYKYISISRLKRYRFDPEKILDKSPSIPMNTVELSFKITNPHEVVIYDDFEDNEWVVFKEEYFPRWKAYINNVEVSVYPTNLNMILIKTIKGNSIVLKYDILKIEKVFSFISLLAVILCVVVFILLLKYDI